MNFLIPSLSSNDFNIFDIGQSIDTLLKAYWESSPENTKLEKIVSYSHDSENVALLSMFRQSRLNPEANKLSDKRLIEIAENGINHCIAFRIPGGDQSWIKRHEVKSLSLLLAYLYGEDARKHGNRTFLVHPLAVAHRGYNLVPDPEIAVWRHERAIGYLLHDVKEDLKTRTPYTELQAEQLIWTCLRGGTTLDETPAQTPRELYIKKIFDTLTDPLGLTKDQRKQHQKTVELSPDCTFGRYLDKFMSVFGDFLEIAAHSVTDRKTKQACYDRAKEKRTTIRSLKIDESYEAMYNSLLEMTAPAKATQIAKSRLCYIESLKKANRPPQLLKTITNRHTSSLHQHLPRRRSLVRPPSWQRTSP